MSRVTRKDFGGPAGRSRPLSRCGGRCRSEGLAPGASRPRAGPWEIATLLYGGTLSALAGPTTASRQSAGRVAPPDGLTLNSEETQLDCCPNVTGTSVGQEAGPIGKSRGDGPRGVVAAVRENSGRLGGSVDGPPSVSRSLSKLRAALAGLAVVAVVGLATPSVLGMVTVSLWTHGPLFDVQGLARLALFLLDAVAWVAWLRIIVALCLDVASGLRQPNDPQRTGGVRGHLAGWVLGFVLLVLPGSAMGAGVAVAAPVASWVSVSSPGPDLTAAQAPPSAPISSVSSTRPAISPAVSPTEGANYTVVSGDCLSTIALHFYGDEGAWTEIWAANANRIMAGGMRFGDPNLIYAGWILTLPGLPGPSPSESIPADPPPTPPSVVHSPASTVSPARPADPPRASGQRPRDGLGDPKSSVPGRTQGAIGSNERHLGAVPTRAGLCQRAGRGRGTWRGYGRRDLAGHWR